MKILVLQIRRIGDVLMTTPLVRAIAGARPDAVIHACLEPFCVPVLRANPHVADTIVTGRGASLLLGPRLRHERYDVVIDTLGTPASARLAWLTAASVRIGFDRPWRRAFYTHAVAPAPAPRYSALDKLALVEPLGIRSGDVRLELFPTERDREEAAAAWDALGLPPGASVAAFSPVSRRRAKVWPADRFAAVCDVLATRLGLRLLPLCAPGEEGMVAAVGAHMCAPTALLTPAPTLSFGALAPVLERCAFYFGNDNGLRHVAVAAGIPTAAVFGRANPASWTPPDTDMHFTAGGDRPMDAVSVSDVTEAVMRAALRSAQRS